MAFDKLTGTNTCRYSPVLHLNNETVEDQHHLIKEHREATFQALNKVTQAPPGS